MSFSERTGNRRAAPPRERYEAAPGQLRALLLNSLQDQWGNRESYRRLSRVVGEIPSPRVVGDATAYGPLVRLVENLEWFEVFDLLEQLARNGRHDDEVNECFSQCGLAYEMRNGAIDLFDPAGKGLGIQDIERETEPLLTDRFAAVRDQYAKAIAALHGRPADLERAVAESVGALEAVARIIAGKRDFAPAIDAALSSRSGTGALAQSLKSIYGWASQVPGARHGRHEEPDLTFADARVAVRLAGVAIAYLIEDR